MSIFHNSKLEITKPINNQVDKKGQDKKWIFGIQGLGFRNHFKNILK